MEHVGKTLRKMREEQGLTLEDVARMTRIRAEILRGLEEGDHHQISEGPFLRGFVKSYARSLGRSEQEIEDLLISMKPAWSEAAKQPSAGHQATPWAWYGVGGLAAIAVVVAVLLANRGHNQAPVPSPAPVPEVKAPVQAAASPSEPAEPAKTVNTSPPPAVSPADYPVHIEVRALEPCWIRLILDEQPSRQVLLAAGENRSWDAKNGGTLTLGNAGGVVVRVNGREYANLGGTGKVLRDITFTSEGLHLPQGVAQ